MRWQDIVIAVAQVLFVVSMIPSIRSNDKPALTTSVMNVILVGIISACLFTLQLWLAAGTAVIIAIAWGVLAFQKLKLNTKRSKT